MTRLLILALLLPLLLPLAAHASIHEPATVTDTCPAAIRCTIEGEIINRPSTTYLVLLKQSDFFYTARVIYIPVRENKFKHTLHLDHEEGYTLIFEEDYRTSTPRPVHFIAEQGNIHFKLHPPGEHDKNTVTGGPLNREALAVSRAISDVIDPLRDAWNAKEQHLEREGKYYTPAATTLVKRLDSLPPGDPAQEPLSRQLSRLAATGDLLTAEALALEKEDNEIAEKQINMELDHAREHPTIVGYTLLLTRTRRAIEDNRDDIPTILDIYHRLYKGKFPGHPYETVFEHYTHATNVRAGAPLIDITATDADGNDVQLSPLIAGKVALIHLWASWCAPCIRDGEEIIPLHEQYKDKGFTVIGIARERDATSATAIACDKQFPWLNLLELNDRHSTWRKHGIANAAGGLYLVGADGRYLAVKTTPAEVKNILQHLFPGNENATTP